MEQRASLPLSFLMWMAVFLIAASLAPVAILAG